jgi:hypothetical protein
MEAQPRRRRSFGATEGCTWLSRAWARGAKLWRCFKHGVLGVHSGDCNQSQRRLQRLRTEDCVLENSGPLRPRLCGGEGLGMRGRMCNVISLVRCTGRVVNRSGDVPQASVHSNAYHIYFAAFSFVPNGTDAMIIPIPSLERLGYSLPSLPGLKDLCDRAKGEGIILLASGYLAAILRPCER